MILDIMSNLSTWWNEVNAWLQTHYSDPLLWLGIFCVGAIFMVFCGGYLKEKGH